MTTALQLRDYQHEAIDAARHAWAHGIRRAAMVLPTGAGKTVVFSALAAQMRPYGVRSLILAHRDELIRQAAAKVRAIAPHLRVGVYQGQTRELRGRDVVVASVQSLTRAERRAELTAEGFRLVIVDEAHHAVANTYMETLRALGCFDERDLSYGAAALGVTATLGRSDRVALGQVWQDVVYRRGIVQMIREGHLVNAKGVRVRVEGLDLGRVKRTGGDFQDGALSEAMHDALAPAAVARAYVEHAKDRLGVLFAPTVVMAYEMADALNAEGITAVGLDGTTPIDDRRRILADHARGDVQVICNCAVLTEGWDAPWCSAAVIARPTSSSGLYVQMAGRVLRPHPGKRDALIIDVVGVTGKHRLASLVDLGGADRVEPLPSELAQYGPDDGSDDLLSLLCPSDPPASGGGAFPGEPGVDGVLTSEIVNLFGSSHSTWLRTPKGVWFLSAGDQLVFLAPGPDVGAYLVGRVVAGRGEWLVSDGVDLELAMTWGEQHAEHVCGKLARKGAQWRKGEVRGAQASMATRLGIPTEGRTRGEVSDEISRALASGRLDVMPCVGAVTERGYW
jgi:superfamily II DNA or RNA helicase